MKWYVVHLWHWLTQLKCVFFKKQQNKLNNTDFGKEIKWAQTFLHKYGKLKVRKSNLNSFGHTRPIVNTKVFSSKNYKSLEVTVMDEVSGVISASIFNAAFIECTHTVFARYKSTVCEER